MLNWFLLHKKAVASDPEHAKNQKGYANNQAGHHHHLFFVPPYFEVIDDLRWGPQIVSTEKAAYGVGQGSCPAHRLLGIYRQGLFHAFLVLIKLRGYFI